MSVGLFTMYLAPGISLFREMFNMSIWIGSDLASSESRASVHERGLDVRRGVRNRAPS